MIQIILIIILAAAVVFLYTKIKNLETEKLKIHESDNGTYSLIYKSKIIYTAKPKTK